MSADSADQPLTDADVQRLIVRDQGASKSDAKGNASASATVDSTRLLQKGTSTTALSFSSKCSQEGVAEGTSALGIREFEGVDYQKSHNGFRDQTDDWIKEVDGTARSLNSRITHVNGQAVLKIDNYSKLGTNLSVFDLELGGRGADVRKSMQTVKGKRTIDFGSSDICQNCMDGGELVLVSWLFAGSADQCEADDAFLSVSPLPHPTPPLSLSFLSCTTCFSLLAKQHVSFNKRRTASASLLLTLGVLRCLC